ncbi:MAG: BtpA/SgcQ family protein [Chloroflexota bacterium]
MGNFIELLKKSKKPIIGMVHLAGLPGSVHFTEPFPSIVQRAVDETEILMEAGFDAVLFQNTGDVPASEEGDEATVAFMTAIGMKLRGISSKILGVNVLMNGSKAALAIAKAISADFVRIKINVGVVATSTGLVQADPHELLAFRNRIGAHDIDIIGDLYDRTAAPVGEFPLEILADLAIRHADVDALVVSGYGEQDIINRLKDLREKLPDAYLVTGGGANLDNLAAFMNISDAIIVGSSIKTHGGFLDPLDPKKVKEFVKKAQQLRKEIQ